MMPNGRSRSSSSPGPPPLGPGAPPLDRLVAYGRARIGFLIEHREIARATLDGSEPIPAGSRTPLSQLHIRVLLGREHGVPTPLNEVLQRLANQAARDHRPPGSATPDEVLALAALPADAG